MSALSNFLCARPALRPTATLLLRPQCRQASKAASQHRWLQKPGNRDYFTGPTHVERVRAWRQAHPGYGRHQGAQPADALQEKLGPQETQKQQLATGLTPHALQDDFFLQPAVFIGLIAHLTGLTLQDDIATTTRRLQGCVPPFTHSALKRAVLLMMPAVRCRLHMDPHGSNLHLSKTKSAG